MDSEFFLVFDVFEDLLPLFVVVVSPAAPPPAFAPPAAVGLGEKSNRLLAR